ncbi:hypothetical protein AB0877_07135 [Micromonospora sp. NPDC047644]|uniref:Cap15 family cyclic dinucleotide receptor domain-containing protein n=1 Tax=Micromonospora sp. NPDC047644 TaxID=3157203 RepID=UPI003451F6D6
MASRAERQFIVAVVAAVWLVLAVFTGQQLTPAPLRLYSVAASAVALLAVAYEHYVWRWRLVRRLTAVPVLAGTWRGKITSSFTDASGNRMAPVAAAIQVAQTASTITITMLTEESLSLSTEARLVRLPDKRWQLTWSYDNTPRTEHRGHSEPHRGSASAAVGARNDEALVGSYYTDRLTRGEIRFQEWSATRYGTAEAALQATDFARPRPFVQRRSQP